MIASAPTMRTLHFSACLPSARVNNAASQRYLQNPARPVKIRNLPVVHLLGAVHPRDADRLDAARVRHADFTPDLPG